MGLTSALLQQKAMGRHRLEARLRKLNQKQMLQVSVLQVPEQDMSATDEALPDLRGMGVLAGKRKRGEELSH